jgi:hypothetical protein
MRKLTILSFAMVSCVFFMNAQDIVAPDYSAHILTPKAPDTPRINGPKVTAARPGADFLCLLCQQ